MEKQNITVPTYHSQICSTSRESIPRWYRYVMGRYPDLGAWYSAINYFDSGLGSKRIEPLSFSRQKQLPTKDPAYKQPHLFRTIPSPKIGNSHLYLGEPWLRTEAEPGHCGPLVVDGNPI